MKAVAYSIKPFEKEYLAKANFKRHDITFISNALTREAAVYADGKDAVIVFTNDDVCAEVIKEPAASGIKYIVTRSTGADHINKAATAKFRIKLSNGPSYSLQAIGKACVCQKDCKAIYQA
ncbi:lactate dehydrogenase-like 2-hydroxyacid dehydrogenase [Mucilaginibacter sp. UYP25]|uniref:lactate dehydrogenase n=1 Tax=unclassified Mucilaginibacter TaxID=2617802 RepID=UPI003394881F